MKGFTGSDPSSPPNVHASTNRRRTTVRSFVRSAINSCGRTNPLQVLQVALLLLLRRFKGGNNLPRGLEITFVRKGGRSRRTRNKIPTTPRSLGLERSGNQKIRQIAEKDPRLIKIDDIVCVTQSTDMSKKSKDRLRDPTL